jgi:hypothetical protein
MWLFIKGFFGIQDRQINRQKLRQNKAPSADAASMKAPQMTGFRLIAASRRYQVEGLFSNHSSHLVVK